jgi:hypothetical protein
LVDARANQYGVAVALPFEENAIWLSVRTSMIELDHYVGVDLRGAPAQCLVVAASSWERISLCGIGLGKTVAQLSLKGSISAVCPHPSERLLALVNFGAARSPLSGHSRGDLLVLSFNGSLIFKAEIPWWRTPSVTTDDLEWMRLNEDAGYSDCRFDPSGRYLWCAVRSSEDTIDVQLRETKGWSVVSRTTVEDPFGDGRACFQATCDPDLWALGIWGGQHGSRTYWVSRGGETISCAAEPVLQNMFHLEFSPAGRECLAVDLDGRLQQWRYPSLEFLGVCEDPCFEDGGPTSFCYIDDEQGLVGSHDGRVFQLHMPTMRIIKEVFIEGLEPRAGDGSDQIISFCRIGDQIIFVRRICRSWDAKLETWRDAVLCLPAERILRQIAKAK